MILFNAILSIGRWLETLFVDSNHSQFTDLPSHERHLYPLLSRTTKLPLLDFREGQITFPMGSMTTRMAFMVQDNVDFRISKQTSEQESDNGLEGSICCRS